MELAALFVSLQPIAGLVLALYSEEGHLLASTSPDTELAEHVPFEASAKSTDIYFYSNLQGQKLAWKHIRSGLLACAPFFLVQASQIDDGTLASLCQCGSSFIVRHLELLEKTRTLKQVIREQEAIIDHISDGLLVMDRLGAVRYLNTTAARLLKLDAVRAIGVPLKELLDYSLNIEPVFRSGKGYIDRELQIDSPNLHLHILDTAIPIRDDEGNVVSVVNTFREMSRVRELSQRMAGDLARYHFTDVLGQNRHLRNALAAAQRAAQADSNVLLYGESGTGKEIFAQAIHNDGRRSNGPFVAINSAALPRDQIESELFGYAAGSAAGGELSGRPGRFEQASGGTIFLDEISEMPLDVQGKLLRVLQERQVTRIGGTRSIPVDVRVVAASSRNLSDMVLQHRFREDLYYRLNVLCIDLPPLRKRGDDIVKLAEEFIRRYCTALHRSPIRLGSKAIDQLLACDWRGNIRQLQNVIERMVNLVDSDQLDEFPEEWLEDKVHRDPLPDEGGSWTRVMTLNEYERLGVRLALEATDYNISQASEVLGITRPTLYAKMKRHGIEVSPKLSERPNFG
ncbi:sigma-54 interaction domain-containing protein [Pseudomonas sp. TCU-HL1]|uniref:sigma-54 interaction domain-containing protein n=1 Tax=Pseudomonas sp. TCU-HL1 TaxID=1856685 RepID=UPI0008559F9A|nr:sigma 54-interacting transcriptional regulator [Pseudomonas sp. TCU-HL1]AOE88121.1 transcriptional regulator AcoR [Pseudomonas sp. TCU-HL1]